MTLPPLSGFMTPLLFDLPLASATERLEGFVFQLLLQLVVIVVAAQLGGWIFMRLGQPRVVGEILAGLILGPSCFGAWFPEWIVAVFPHEADLQLRVLGQIGLVLLMFDVGLSFDFGHLREVKSTALSVALAGIVLPLGLAIGLAMVMHPYVAAGYPIWPFALFVATAVSITAIPILGRIMMDLRLEGTPLGVLTISAAAMDDALGWIILAVVSGLVTGGFEPTSVAWQLGGLVALVAASVGIIKPLVNRIADRLDWSEGSEGIVPLACLLIGIFGFAICTNLLGVFSVFGPFIFGSCLSHRRDVRAFYRRSGSVLVAAMLLPVFFTFTGLRTDINALDASGWWWCLALLAVACLGKMGGCGVAARLSGCTARESMAVAVMMNTRALMGLVAINVGRDLGAIPDQVFSMLVIMAIATTVMTVPLLKWLVDVPPLKSSKEASGPAAAIPIDD